MNSIYLDHAATTPIDHDINDFMHEIATQAYANPSSIHSAGQQSKVFLEKARKTLADTLNCRASDVIFTAGGTESNNLAILGLVRANTHRGKHLITSKVEHPSVLNVFHFLETLGYSVSYLEVDDSGQPNLNQLKSLLRNDTILVSLMYANNETGCLFPIAEIGQVLKNHTTFFHCDAVQAFGKVKISLSELNVDLLSLSAHKIYGPKGVGALVIREAVPVNAILFGGSQEIDRRPGTENLPAIAGFAKTVEKMDVYLDSAHTVTSMRNLFEQKLKEKIPGIIINGEYSERVCGHSNIYFPFISGDSMLINLDQEGIAVSTGSACSSGANKPSYVLESMGFNNKRVRNSIRFSFGRTNTSDEIYKIIDAIFTINQRIEAGKSLM